MFETIERIFTTPHLIPQAGMLIGLAGICLAFFGIIAKTITTIHQQTINGKIKRDLIEQGVSPAEAEEYTKAFHEIDMGKSMEQARQRQEITKSWSEPAKQQAH